MKKSHWFLLILSAILYPLPFLFSAHLWWIIFFFPVPLLYVTCTENLSFTHGYVWGCITFLLHLNGGMCVVATLAHNSWLIGVIMGISMVLYQALFSALLFLCVARIVRLFSVCSPIIRMVVWSMALALFIFWVDRYCLSLFGICEGYPLMHPLVPLAQQPYLLLLLPIVGKQLTTILFLLIATSLVAVLWYKNYAGMFFFASTIGIWLTCCLIGSTEKKQRDWHAHIKSLPCMAHTMVDNPIVTIKVVAQQLKRIIAHYSATELIIMPESAFNITHFEDLPELLQLWNEENLGKAIHLVFGTCRFQQGAYYNSLHWVHNGVLQRCFDKKHAMLISERLADWMNNAMMRKIYFKDGLSITRSCNDRVPLRMSDALFFVPYICSELFFNDLADDQYDNEPIIAVVNDILFCNSYIQKLLVLLAQFRAIQWQRDIVYVSYGYSLFIDAQARIKNINEDINL